MYKLIVAALLVALAICAFAQQWIPQTSGTTSNLRRVSFTDANNGWVVGDGGTILHTTNGGINWTIQTSGTTCDLNAVAFTDANNGWIATGSTIIHTTNGGTTWTVQDTNSSYAIVFTDANNGWSVSNYIRHTTNGGINWTVQTSGTTYGYGLRSVAFTDANNGWAVGYGRMVDTLNSYSIILHTTNGGTTWTRQNYISDYILLEVAFTDANNGWAVGYSSNVNGVILHTTNGGTTWIQDTLTLTPDGVAFTDANNGWVTCAIWSGAILHTTNGGSTWITENTTRSYGVFFTDANNGWTVGESGVILHYSGTTSAPETQNAELPTSSNLRQNYPNPFNPSTLISFDLPKTAKVILSVYDVNGRIVATLANDTMSAGNHELTFDGSRLVSGIYFVRMQTTGQTMTRKMLLVK